MTAQQHKEALETGAKPPDEFLEELLGDMKRTLDERHYHLWNGRIQTILKRAIDQALPPLHEWDENDKGEAHLHDLASMMLGLRMDDEIEALHQRHPSAFHKPGTHNPPIGISAEAPMLGAIDIGVSQRDLLEAAGKSTRRIRERNIRQ